MSILVLLAGSAVGSAAGGAAGTAAGSATGGAIGGEVLGPAQMASTRTQVVRDWHTRDQYFSDIFGPESGLPQINVTCALQTRDGYLWVGTGGGLARFDGVRFATFGGPDTPALVNTHIRCLHEARDGSLWIGTERGAVRYHDGRFEAVGPRDVHVVAIAEAAGGRVWLGTIGKGVYAWESGRVIADAAGPSLGNARVASLLADSAGRLWIGLDARPGVACYSGGALVQQPTDVPLNDGVYSMAEIPKGTVWLGTGSHGLYRLNGGTLSEVPTGDGPAGVRVVGIVPALDGGIWVASTKAVKHLAPSGPASIRTISGVPTESYIASVCEDREGSLWLCTNTDGLIQVRRMPYRSLSTEQGLPARIVKTVAEDPQGNVWMATKYGGVARIAEDGTATTYSSGTGEPNVVFPAGDGSVWVGYSGTSPAWLWRAGTWEPVPGIRGLRTVYEDRTGALWLATSGSGLFRYTDGRAVSVPTGAAFPPARVSSFSEGPDGSIYIGTWESGLFRYKDGRTSVFNRSNGLPTNQVRAVYVDREDEVWIGTRGAGITVRSKDRWWNSNALTEAVGVDVTAIIEDDFGRLWLGTANGVMWTQKEALLTALRDGGTLPEIHPATTPEGAHIAPVWSGPQPIVWRTADRRLLFATARGILSVSPELVAVDRTAPAVHIESAAVDGRPADPRGTLKVPAGSRGVSIDYTAVSFLQPKRIKFRYKLEGYDRDWVDAGSRRTAFYTHLPAGAYTFRVTACNSDGTWSGVGDHLALDWQPHFYETPWFFGLALASSAAIALGLHRWRVSALRREKEHLERRVAERTQELELANAVVMERTRELELANTAKTEFLEHVSHEICNPLNGLNGLLGFLHKESLPPEARTLARSVQACANVLTRVFEQVLSFSKLEYGSLELQEAPFSLTRLLHEAAESSAWQAAQRGNAIRVEAGPNLVDHLEGDAGKIRTVIGNFLANAIKYAPGGPIVLRAETYPNESAGCQVHIEVTDCGPGIPAGEQELIFKKFIRGSNTKRNTVAGTGLGLAICRVLARALGGNVGVDSPPGGGATFYLSVPLRCATAPAGADEAVPIAAEERALIVEDEHYNQIVLKGIALELGYRPDVASSSEEAARLVEQGRYSAIFVDWELPGSNGDVVARHVRSQPWGGEPVIIATTAYDSDDVRRRCREAGMDGFLRKPYDIVQLRRRISEARGLRQGRDQPAEQAAAEAGAPGLNLRALQLYARAVSGGVDEATERFVEALEEELAGLRGAAEEGDWRNAARRAHRIRALGGLVAAAELAEAAQRFEQLAAGPDDESRRTALDALTCAAAALGRRIDELTTGSVPRA